MTWLDVLTAWFWWNVGAPVLMIVAFAVGVPLLFFMVRGCYAVYQRIKGSP